MAGSTREQAACIACRLGLAYGIGDILIRRVELNTPLHSLISIREGIFWKQIGRSPYTASVFRGPPLLLQFCGATAHNLILQASLLSLIDWITSRVLSRVAQLTVQCYQEDNAGIRAFLRRVMWLIARFNWLVCPVDYAYIRDSIQFLYLVNPFLILSTAAGSASNLANLAVFTTLYGGLSGNAALAGLGLAAGFYLSTHPVLLLVSKLECRT